MQYPLHFVHGCLVYRENKYSHTKTYIYFYEVFGVAHCKGKIYLNYAYSGPVYFTLKEELCNKLMQPTNVLL